MPSFLTEQILSLVESGRQTRLKYGAICSGVFLLGAVLLYIELHSLFSVNLRLLLIKDELGKVEITESCVGKFINYEARQFSEISDAKSQIINKKDGLRIKSKIFVQPDTKISEIGQNLQNRLKYKLESKIGLIISNITITAKFNQKTNRSKKSLNEILQIILSVVKTC